jgi:hypothetical protein
MSSAIEGSEFDTRQANSLQTQYPIQSLPGVVSWKKQLKREADHSQPTAAQEENSGAVSPWS